MMKPYKYPDGEGREPDATIMDYHKREAKKMSEDPKERFNKGMALLSLADSELQHFANKDLLERFDVIERDLIDRHATSEDFDEIEKFKEKIREVL